ncbi:hypothetical protein QR685DRAFT_535216 [Neurospora intermedia]|uniref:Uncharacterized protein n=1 Tax=Neurospora intermedia TaxID=5142 RepID=A0ABR3D1E8_NEUIN
MYFPLLLLFSVLCQEIFARAPTNPLLWSRQPCSIIDMPYHSGMRGRNGIYWG